MIKRKNCAKRPCIRSENTRCGAAFRHRYKWAKHEMNRLQNAQKLLAESLAALESAVDQAQSSAALAATGNGSGTASVETAPALDISQLSQDLSAIETDLETAMKMIADLTASGLSSGAGKDRI